MQCPNDQATLLMTERQGIEIDYCPQCRGVWLDRGELDKLIVNSATPSSPAPEANRPHHDAPHYNQAPQQYNHNSQPYHKKHKKESFIGDLFDF